MSIVAITRIYQVARLHFAFMLHLSFETVQSNFAIANPILGGSEKYYVGFCFLINSIYFFWLLQALFFHKFCSHRLSFMQEKTLDITANQPPTHTHTCTHTHARTHTHNTRAHTRAGARLYKLQMGWCILGESN